MAMTAVDGNRVPSRLRQECHRVHAGRDEAEVNQDQTSCDAPACTRIWATQCPGVHRRIAPKRLRFNRYGQLSASQSAHKTNKAKAIDKSWTRNPYVLIQDAAITPARGHPD